MGGSLVRWFTDRWPIKEVLHWGLDEEIRGGPSYYYVFGACLLFVFANQVITGIWQLFYYVPTTGNAYASVIFTRQNVPFGWLIYNLHHWGNNAMILLVGLHMTQVFVWGAYKKPRQLIWLLGVCLLLLVLVMSFTGAVLIWDEFGYWVGAVGTNMMGTVPLVGAFMKKFMLVGGTMGQAALSRFFTLHIAIVPLLLGGFAVLHVIAFRRFGNAGPWDPEKRKRRGPFWPDQIVMDLLIITVVFLAITFLAAFIPDDFTGPADPADNTYEPKPEWNFLFLYQFLKLFKGPWETVGTFGVPLVATLLIFLVPWFDRGPERSPRRRPWMMAGAAAFAAWVLAFAVMGYYSHPATAGLPEAKQPVAAAATPEKPTPAEERGRGLFETQGCTACHVIDGKGGSTGPDLSGEGNARAREWVMQQIRDPKSHDPKGIMPAFATLGDAQLSDLADYLMSRKSGPAKPATEGAASPGTGTVSASAPSSLPASGKQGAPGPAAYTIGKPEHGGILYAQSCRQCHGPEGKGSVPNPGSASGTVPGLNPIAPEMLSQDPDKFAGNIDRSIQHGSMPKGPHPALTMPAWGDSDSLTQPAIAQIEAYILALNGVDRARVVEPGVRPGIFFAVTAGVFVVAWTVALVWWILRGREEGPEPPSPR